MDTARDLVEVEVKAPVPDLAAITRRLAARGAAPRDLIEERDTYYAHPARDFGRTDEALRVRVAGAASEITYKGPKLDAATKTRREVTLPIADPEAAGALFTSLGFREVATVVKRRQRFTLGPITIALDEVDGVGTYAEIERLVTVADVDRARSEVLTLARELGLAALERRSYLELLLDKEVL